MDSVPLGGSPLPSEPPCEAVGRFPKPLGGFVPACCPDPAACSASALREPRTARFPELAQKADGCVHRCM